MRRLPLVIAALVLCLALGWWLLAAEPPAATPEGAAEPPSPRAAVAPAPQPVRLPTPPAPVAVAAEEPPPDGLGELEAPRVVSADGGSDLEDGGMSPALARERIKAFLARNAADAEKYIDRYCEAARGLKPLKSAGATERKRDAALYMGVRVDWEDGRVGLLHLPKSLTDRMANPPYNWRTFTPADYAGLDFSWMKELEQFDCWSLSGDGPLKGEVRVAAAEVPLPNYVVLQSWVKLRLVKGLNEGDLPTAVREVRHLGELISSSGTLVSDMIHLAFYGIERGFLEARGISPEDPPYSLAEVQSLRHASFGGVYLLYPGVPHAVKEKALKCMPVRCTGLNEALSFTSSVREFVDTAGELEWLQQQSPCDPSLARTLANAPPYDEKRLQELVSDSVLSGGGGIGESMRALLDGGT